METDKNKLKVYSYSKVLTYKSCKKKYHFAYIEKLPRKKEQPFTIFGSFCHEVLENFHRYYLDDKTKDILYLDAMRKSFSSARQNWQNKLTKEQTDEAYAILLDYLMIVSAETKEEKPIILDVEKKIWAPIDDEIVLYGYIDRVQKDPDKILHVIDYKTTKDPKYLKDRTQLLLYCYSLLLEDDSIETIRTSYILLKHNMKYLTAEHNKEEIIEAKDTLLKNCRDISEEKLFRASPTRFNCTYCDYIDHCKEGKDLVYNSKKYVGKIKW